MFNVNEPGCTPCLRPTIAVRCLGPQPLLSPGSLGCEAILLFQLPEPKPLSETNVSMCPRVAASPSVRPPLHPSTPQPGSPSHDRSRRPRMGALRGRDGGASRRDEARGRSAPPRCLSSHGPKARQPRTAVSTGRDRRPCQYPSRRRRAQSSKRNSHAQEGCRNGGGILVGAFVLAVEQRFQLILQISCSAFLFGSVERIHGRSVVVPERSQEA